MAHGAGLGVVKDDRRFGFFQFVENRIEVRVGPFFTGDRRGFDVECLAAQLSRAVQKRKPTDIFNESVFVGCEPFEDGLFEWAVEYLGGDRLVLATDSPHWDSSVPGQVTGPVAKSTKISQDNKRKVLGENAINLLGLGL